MTINKIIDWVSSIKIWFKIKPSLNWLKKCFGSQRNELALKNSSGNHQSIIIGDGATVTIYQNPQFVGRKSLPENHFRKDFNNRAAITFDFSSLRQEITSNTCNICSLVWKSIK
jgi:hypothetical protein